MSGLICPEPEFVFDEQRNWWSPCIACGRIAWDHEQADPVADMQGAISAGFTRPWERPPVMRPSA